MRIIQRHHVMEENLCPGLQETISGNAVIPDPLSHSSSTTQLTCKSCFATGHTSMSLSFISTIPNVYPRCIAQSIVVNVPIGYLLPILPMSSTNRILTKRMSP